jgi:hypothetical protein
METLKVDLGAASDFRRHGGFGAARRNRQALQIGERCVLITNVTVDRYYSEPLLAGFKASEVADKSWLRMASATRT